MQITRLKLRQCMNSEGCILCATVKPKLQPSLFQNVFRHFLYPMPSNQGAIKILKTNIYHGHQIAPIDQNKRCETEEKGLVVVKITHHPHRGNQLMITDTQNNSQKKSNVGEKCFLKY